MNGDRIVTYSYHDPHVLLMEIYNNICSQISFAICKYSLFPDERFHCDVAKVGQL